MALPALTFDELADIPEYDPTTGVPYSDDDLAGIYAGRQRLAYSDPIAFKNYLNTGGLSGGGAKTYGMTADEIAAYNNAENPFTAIKDAVTHAGKNIATTIDAVFRGGNGLEPNPPGPPGPPYVLIGAALLALLLVYKIAK